MCLNLGVDINHFKMPPEPPFEKEEKYLYPHNIHKK